MKFSVPETEEVSINLTPLIDIVFLLLIFFMVSTTFQRETDWKSHCLGRPNVLRTVVSALFLKSMQQALIG